MATLNQAEDARRSHGERLAEGGAHAVGVEPGEPFGYDGYVVVAYAEPDAKVDLPDSLETKRSKTSVPVVVRRGERAKPG
jgi:hypothetical protein